MRKSVIGLGTSGFLALSCLAIAAPPAAAPRSRPVPPVISTHQIDRFDAIKKTQARLDKEPNSLADWVILGELAHEVALNLPEDQARAYLATSREAFQKALNLAPHNAGIKAAVQFASDMEANLSQFERARDKATETYLAARRRDVALANYTPAIAVYARRPAGPGVAVAGASARGPRPNYAAAAAPTGAPNPGGRGAAPLPRAGALPVPGGGPGTAAAPGPAVRPGSVSTAGPGPAGAPAGLPVTGEEVVTNPPLPNDPTTDNATYGARLYYGSLPTYRGFVGIDGTSPLTYKEYSSAYYPAGLYDDPAIPPITPQRAGMVGPNGTLDDPIATPADNPR